MPNNQIEGLTICCVSMVETTTNIIWIMFTSTVFKKHIYLKRVGNVFENDIF